MDYSEFYKTINTHHAQGLPFVMFSFPDSTEITAMMQEDDALHFMNEASGAGFILSHFNSQHKAVCIPSDKSSTIHTHTRNRHESFTHIELPNHDLGLLAEEHMSLVQQAIDEINSSELEKVIVSRKETLQLANLKPLEVLPRLIHLYPDAFVYQFFHPEIGYWMGASPEQFIKKDGRAFRTMSLAGTKVFVQGKDPEWTPKELMEQQIVTQYILDSLNPLCEEINLSPTTNKKAGKLWHLLNSVEGQLKEDINLEDIIEKVHPTPAVCGFPKEKALAFIEQKEPYNREFYTGFLGLVDSDNAKADLYVNLRCMSYSEGKFNIYVGGGITANSQPEAEWEETVAKAKTMKRVFED